MNETIELINIIFDDAAHWFRSNCSNISTYRLTVDFPQLFRVIKLLFFCTKLFHSDMVSISISSLDYKPAHLLFIFCSFSFFPRIFLGFFFYPSAASSCVMCLCVIFQFPPERIVKEEMCYLWSIMQVVIHQHPKNN